MLLNSWATLCALAIIALLVHSAHAQTPKKEEKVKPYEFGFTIDEYSQQHRHEKRDERGIIMGEFGFITADGIYHVTVYATDEEGKFRILAMRSFPFEAKPKTIDMIVKSKPATATTTRAPPTTISTTTLKAIIEKKVLPKFDFNTQGCAGCFLKNGKDATKNEPNETSEPSEGISAKTQIPQPSQLIPLPPRNIDPAGGKVEISRSKFPQVYSNQIVTTANRNVVEQTNTSGDLPILFGTTLNTRTIENDTSTHTTLKHTTANHATPTLPHTIRVAASTKSEVKNPVSVSKATTLKIVQDTVTQKYKALETNSNTRTQFTPTLLTMGSIAVPEEKLPTALPTQRNVTFLVNSPKKGALNKNLLLANIPTQAQNVEAAIGARKSSTLQTTTAERQAKTSTPLSTVSKAPIQSESIRTEAIARQRQKRPTSVPVTAFNIRSRSESGTTLPKASSTTLYDSAATFSVPHEVKLPSQPISSNYKNSIETLGSGTTYPTYPKLQGQPSKTSKEAHNLDGHQEKLNSKTGGTQEQETKLTIEHSINQATLAAKEVERKLGIKTLVNPISYTTYQNLQGQPSKTSLATSKEASTSGNVALVDEILSSTIMPHNLDSHQKKLNSAIENSAELLLKTQEPAPELTSKQSINQAVLATKEGKRKLGIFGSELPGTGKAVTLANSDVFEDNAYKSTTAQSINQATLTTKQGDRKFGMFAKESPRAFSGQTAIANSDVLENNSNKVVFATETSMNKENIKSERQVFTNSREFVRPAPQRITTKPNQPKTNETHEAKSLESATETIFNARSDLRTAPTNTKPSTTFKSNAPKFTEPTVVKSPSKATPATQESPIESFDSPKPYATSTPRGRPQIIPIPILKDRSKEHSNELDVKSSSSTTVANNINNLEARVKVATLNSRDSITTAFSPTNKAGSPGAEILKQTNIRLVTNETPTYPKINDKEIVKSKQSRVYSGEIATTANSELLGNRDKELSTSRDTINGQNTVSVTAMEQHRNDKAASATSEVRNAATQPSLGRNSKTIPVVNNALPTNLISHNHLAAEGIRQVKPGTNPPAQQYITIPTYSSVTNELSKNILPTLENAKVPEQAKRPSVDRVGTTTESKTTPALLRGAYQSNQSKTTERQSPRTSTYDGKSSSRTASKSIKPQLEKLDSNTPSIVILSEEKSHISTPVTYQASSYLEQYLSPPLATQTILKYTDDRKQANSPSIDKVAMTTESKTAPLPRGASQSNGLNSTEGQRPQISTYDGRSSSRAAATSTKASFANLDTNPPTLVIPNEEKSPSQSSASMTYQTSSVLGQLLSQSITTQKYITTTLSNEAPVIPQAINVLDSSFNHVKNLPTQQTEITTSDTKYSGPASKDKTIFRTSDTQVTPSLLATADILTPQGVFSRGRDYVPKAPVPNPVGTARNLELGHSHGFARTTTTRQRQQVTLEMSKNILPTIEFGNVPTQARKPITESDKIEKKLASFQSVKAENPNKMPHAANAAASVISTIQNPVNQPSKAPSTRVIEDQSTSTNTALPRKSNSKVQLTKQGPTATLGYSPKSDELSTLAPSGKIIVQSEQRRPNLEELATQGKSTSTSAGEQKKTRILISQDSRALKGTQSSKPLGNVPLQSFNAMGRAEATTTISKTPLTTLHRDTLTSVVPNEVKSLPPPNSTTYVASSTKPQNTKILNSAPVIKPTTNAALRKTLEPKPTIDRSKLDDTVENSKLKRVYQGQIMTTAYRKTGEQANNADKLPILPEIITFGAQNNENETPIVSNTPNIHNSASVENTTSERIQKPTAKTISVTNNALPIKPKSETQFGPTVLVKEDSPGQQDQVPRPDMKSPEISTTKNGLNTKSLTRLPNAYLPTQETRPIPKEEPAVRISKTLQNIASKAQTKTHALLSTASQGATTDTYQPKISNSQSSEIPSRQPLTSFKIKSSLKSASTLMNTPTASYGNAPRTPNAGEVPSPRIVSKHDNSIEVVVSPTTYARPDLSGQPTKQSIATSKETPASRNVEFVDKTSSSTVLPNNYHTFETKLRPAMENSASTIFKTQAQAHKTITDHSIDRATFATRLGEQKVRVDKLESPRIFSAQTVTTAHTAVTGRNELPMPLKTTTNDKGIENKALLPTVSKNSRASYSRGLKTDPNRQETLSRLSMTSTEISSGATLYANNGSTRAPTAAQAPSRAINKNTSTNAVPVAVKSTSRAAPRTSEVSIETLVNSTPYRTSTQQGQLPSLPTVKSKEIFPELHGALADKASSPTVIGNNLNILDAKAKAATLSSEGLPFSKASGTVPTINAGLSRAKQSTGPSKPQTIPTANPDNDEAINISASIKSEFKSTATQTSGRTIQKPIKDSSTYTNIELPTSSNAKLRKSSAPADVSVPQDKQATRTFTQRQRTNQTNSTRADELSSNLVPTLGNTNVPTQSTRSNVKKVSTSLTGAPKESLRTKTQSIQPDRQISKTSTSKPVISLKARVSSTSTLPTTSSATLNRNTSEAGKSTPQSTVALNKNSMGTPSSSLTYSTPLLRGQPQILPRASSSETLTTPPNAFNPNTPSSTVIPNNLIDLEAKLKARNQNVATRNSTRSFLKSPTINAGLTKSQSRNPSIDTSITYKTPLLNTTPTTLSRKTPNTLSKTPTLTQHSTVSGTIANAPGTQSQISRTTQSQTPSRTTVGLNTQTSAQYPTAASGANEGKPATASGGSSSTEQRPVIVSPNIDLRASLVGNADGNNVNTNGNIGSAGVIGGIGKSGLSGGSSSVGDETGDLYRFKYILDYNGHTETGSRNGNKVGNYFSIGEDNVERTIEYVANEFGYQPRIRWRKLDVPVASKENTLKEYEFIWFKKE